MAAVAPLQFAHQQQSRVESRLRRPGSCGPTVSRNSSLTPIWATDMVTRFLCGLVLTVAAALKAESLFSDAALGVLYGSRPGQVLLLQFEILLAVWLIVGFQAAWSRRVAIVTFGVFAGVSLFHAIAGAESCGCFGRMQVNPWLMLAMDVVLVALLWRWSPDSREQAWAKAIFASRTARWLSAAAIVALLAGSFVLLHYGTRSGRYSIVADGIAVQGDTVVLRPEAWLGSDCPLLGLVDGDAPLRHGEWIAVLYRHDCETCRKAVIGYRLRATARQAGEASIALIELPPHDQEENVELPAPSMHLRLSDHQQWLVQTPMIIRLRDSKVISIDSTDHADSIGMESAAKVAVW